MPLSQLDNYLDYTRDLSKQFALVEKLTTLVSFYFEEHRIRDNTPHANQHYNQVQLVRLQNHERHIGL